MVRIGSVVMHVGDRHRAARFWGEALGYVVAGGEIGDETAILVPGKGQSGPLIALDEDDRMHLDLVVADEAEQRAEVERLIALGARRVPWTYSDGGVHAVLSDTEGNLFCVVIGPIETDRAER